MGKGKGGGNQKAKNGVSVSANITARDDKAPFADQAVGVIIDGVGYVFGALTILAGSFLFKKWKGRNVDSNQKALPAVDETLSASIREYVNYNLDDNTEMKDIGSIIKTVIEKNPELEDQRGFVGEITAEMVKSHVASRG